MNRLDAIVPSVPVSNIRRRKQFRGTRKFVNESIAQWHSRLLNLANACNFDIAFDYFLLEQFICGLDDEYIDRLCQEFDSITLEQSLQILSNHEQKKGFIEPIAEIKVEPLHSQMVLKVEPSDEIEINENEVQVAAKSDCLLDNDDVQETKCDDEISLNSHSNDESWDEVVSNCCSCNRIY